MGTLKTIVEPYSPLLFVLLVLAVLVLSFLVFRQSRQLRSVRNLWQSLSATADGGNLEQLIQNVLRQHGALQTDIRDLAERLSVTENKLRTSKRYVGLVRYNAFEDVGGDQSFSMAIYDEEGNGAVMSSQVGRNDCRVFGKQIVAGRSEVNLTVEEERAIELAATAKARPRISQ